MKNYIKVTLLSLLVFTMSACSSTTPKLKGFYQSAMIGEDVVQISIFDNENRFVQFITNRKVNSGTYTLKEDGLYQLDGNEHDFDIRLNDDNSFEIMMPKLDKAKTVLMKNISDIPSTFSDEWDDIEEYKELLK